MQFTTELNDYNSMLVRLTALINLGRELPDQVFRVTPARFVFVAEGLVWRTEAWPALTELARYYGDAAIDLVANPQPNPDWRAYGYHHLGAATIGIDENSQAYHAFAWEGDPRALILGSMTLAMVVRSGGFAMWSQRARDLAVFALYDRPGRPAVNAPFGLPTLDMDEALGILSMGISDPATFAEVAEQMRRNYRLPNISELANQVGRVVELTFSNGQVVRVKLQAVDVDESEIAYRVAQLVAPGSAPLRTGTPGAAVIADIGDLVQFRCVE